MSNNGKHSAELEREVEAQRQKIEDRIGEIKDRLSPGQIVDELLSYTKHGGQHFAANLGQTVSNNPLPAALLGISLIWLMSGQGPRLSMGPGDRSDRYEDDDLPYAIVSGRMRRVGHTANDSGKWYSEFEDATGKRYTAESNELGHRAGAFMDNAGRRFGGFIDEAGRRVSDFQDEAGNRLDDLAGWASHRWRDVQRTVSGTLDQVGQQAQHLGGAAQHQMDRTSRMIMDTFQNQPLVAGALAFAAGAALGAALPHTAEEDQMVGKLADKVKGKAAEAASDLYEEGKSRAADLYEQGKQGAAEVYDDLMERNRNPDLH